MPLAPSDLTYGYVRGRYILASGDTVADLDRLPDARAASGSVRFRWLGPAIVASQPVATAVVPLIVDAGIDPATGDLLDETGSLGVWLVAGRYEVTFRFVGVTVPTFEIQVTTEHTDATPLQLPAQAPLQPAPGERFIVNEQVWRDTLLARDEALAAAELVTAPTDVQIASRIADRTSASRVAVDGAVESNAAVAALIAKTVVVEDYRLPTDNSDDQCWQRAVGAAVTSARSGVPVRLLATRTVYTIANPISLNGLTQGLIEGAGGFGAGTIFRPKPGSGFGAVETRAIVFRVNSANPSAIAGLTFRNLTFDGTLAAEPTGHARDTRQYGAEWIATAIRIDGPTPTSPNNKKVDSVEFDNVRCIGLRDLPVIVNGATNVYWHDGFIRRSKDPGFTYCKSVRFQDSRIEASADNGVSVSRGCSEVVISGNTISGSFYAGIHVSGFSGEAGPDLVSVTGNTVLDSRQYGISLINGARTAVVSGNVVRGVQRGTETTGGPENLADTNGVAYGSGILVGGLLTEGANPALLASYALLASDVTITGNTVSGADRMGICLWRGVRSALVTGNTVVDIGSEKHVDGTNVSSTHNYYNVGIGYYTPYSATIASCVVTGNLIVDTRATSLTNYGVYPIDSGVVITGQNTVVNPRNKVVGIGSPGGFREGVTVGRATDVGTSLRIRGSGSAARGLTIANADVDEWGIRETTSGGLEIVDLKTGLRVMAFGTAQSGWFVPLTTLRTITGVTANLYLDSNGEVRRIVSA